MPTARRRRVPRRFLTAGLAALLTTTGALAVTGQPASALQNYVQPMEVAWTDNAQPTRSFPAEDGSLPVGTWQGTAGDKHTSRAYFTFDLSDYHGQRIISARAVTGERSVTNCDKPRELQLWRTENPTTAPTWKNAPTAVEKLADLTVSGPACPASYLSTAITDAVSKAVAAKQDKLTLMLRIGEHEDGVLWGRRVTTLGVSLEHNTAPNIPTNLAAGGVACRDDMFIGTTRPELQAVVTDPDVNETGGGDPLKATFAWWPVDRPTERTELEFTYALPSGSRFQYTVPDGVMVHGGRYAFSVRATDQYADTSPWSPECRFTVDTKVPPAPTVSSTDYPSGWNPHGGPGIPGRFTLTAPGADDLAGFRYGLSGAITYVSADAAGTATISVTPTMYGFNQLYVQAVDRTGNRSPQTSYEFRVQDTAPRITDGNPTGAFGEPRELTLAPVMENVIEYTWRLNGGEPATVPAAGDGTAKVTITPRTGGLNTVTVTSRTSDDLPSGTAEYRFYLANAPVISSPDFPLDGGDGPLAGTTGSFTFAPGMPGVTEYVWSVNGGEQQTVAAKQDGTASVTYTPTWAGFQWIEVFSRTADGTESEITSGYFGIVSHAPEVGSADYPMYREAGGPGVTGAFTFRPAHEGVTGYVYDFGDGPQTVAAAADGTATINWTPRSYPADSSGWVRLTVREKVGDIVSDETEYPFILGKLAPTVTSAEYPAAGEGGGPGIAGSFTLTATMPGTTEFVYRFGTEEKTVPAGPDGTATITLTPTEGGGNFLFLSSRTDSGITSGEDYYYFYVTYPS
ncbi:DNRLRE domain-containing protein [Micromonospora sp. U56]|uniref:DNRLRE domain-containing protein n=1 Tax=Micromonospora sp. U56 TaxID=2824900 RepID=UPI001B38FD2C|nr:DNRLRE domain-containing protein [Micromonospora sp. U56]MBQ0892025.1 DNRLRE domain-containing protein [Micromonospora sp. U56]